MGIQSPKYIIELFYYYNPNINVLSTCDVLFFDYKLMFFMVIYVVL